MANSNKIKQYFANPTNLDLEKIAFDEIADYRRALIGNTLFWVNDIDKKFYFDSTYAYTVNPETPDNYWYSLTLHETEKYNFNINYNPSIEKTDIWINAPVFDNKGKAIGMLGTGIDLAAFIESIYKNYSGNASLYFFNSSGEITGARDANLVAKKMHISELLGKTGEKIFKSTVNLSTAEINEFIVQDGIIAVGSVPVFDWYITVIQHIDIRDYIKTDIIIVFVIVFMSIILFFVLFSILS
jgi:methyl-accepting chemotaxis protein